MGCYIRAYYDGVPGYIPSEGNLDADEGMGRHCDLLIRKDEEAAQTYAAMADEYRLFARQVAEPGAKLG